MIVSYEAWGTLVQKWAIGDDPDFPLPRDLSDVKDQCSKIAEAMDLTTEGDVPRWRAVIDLPDTMSGLAILQNSREVLAIRLPAKKAVEEVIGRMSDPLHSGDAYPLPNFYADQFGHASLRFRNADEKRKFLSMRIGDYSVSNCLNSAGFRCPF